MKNMVPRIGSVLIVFCFIGCAGVKVVNPNDDTGKDAGTKMLAFNNGKPTLVSTHTCRLASSGKKFSAIGKTENEARTEVLARCRDNTVISFCEAGKVTCEKN